MREKLQRFLQGRNGYDQYSRFLNWVSVGALLVSMLLSAIFGTASKEAAELTAVQRVFGGYLPSILWAVAIALLVYAYFRVFSKNIYRRQSENAKHLSRVAKCKGGWQRFCQRIKDMRYYKYFKCPDCKATLRVPRKKGKVAITCKKCGKRFTGRT